MAENVGGRKHWELSNIDYLEHKTVAIGPQITHGYWIFCTFEGENFGDHWPLIHQICYMISPANVFRYTIIKYQIVKVLWVKIMMCMWSIAT